MSGDLISREAIIKILEKDLQTGDATLTISWLKTWLELQETVDAERVIRCKDCKYHFIGECSHPAMGSDDRDARLYVNDDDFCSRGEQK